MSSQPTDKKKIGKHIRLFDFRVYDKIHETDTSESSDESEDSKKKTPSCLMIQMFGITEQGETASITITDYEPFFFIKVPNYWTKHELSMFESHLRDQPSIKRMQDDILRMELIQRQQLYGFTAGKLHNFAIIKFRNMNVFSRVKQLWNYTDKMKNRRLGKYMYNGQKLEIYESNIPPILRYFHIHYISPSGWVFLKTTLAQLSREKTTTCNYEYICKKRAIEAANDKESRVPYKICSFDIEASSSHGDFPIPVKSYKKLAMNIVDLFQEYSSLDTDMDYDRGCVLFRNAIYAAFDFKKFNNVDIVYPKRPPTKDAVEKLTEKLLQNPINKVRESKDANSRATTIDKMFQKAREREESKPAVERLDDDESDSDAEDREEIEEGEMDYDDEYDEIVHLDKEIAKHDSDDDEKPVKKKKTPPKNTIIHLLLEPTIEREDKIQKTMETLDKVYPALEGDTVTFIGSTFLRYGEEEPYKNHCIAVGSCDPVEGCEIVSCRTERDLLLEWKQLIQKENPDIIIGYNIFGFDYEFIYRRAQETGCEEEFMYLTRNIGESSLVTKKNDGMEYTDIENTKVALASGEYDLRYPKMTGRIQIDMLMYCRREFQWSSYKLDDVASQNISDDIKFIETCISENETKLYSQNLMGLHVGDFIHLEIVGFSSDYYGDGQKFKVKDIRQNVEYAEGKKSNMIVIEGAHAISVGKKKIKWGMAKDDVTPQDIFRLSNGSSADRAIVAKYCIQDCNLVHHLMRKLDVVTGYVEMANICSVPISFLIFRGQGIKLTSFVAKKCREKNTLMPDLDKTLSDGGYEGAIVLPPKCSMYMDNPVACVDYSSLYPSSMISQNFSHDSKVWSIEYDLQGNMIREWGEKDANGKFVYDKLPGYEYITMEFDTFRYIRPHGKPMAAAVKTKCGKQICCWAQLPNSQKSIMPAILEELLKARKDTRNKAKTFEKTDPFMANVLDKRQLGYKVTANSLYGQCGARTSTFYEKDVAACTTATGRMMITYAKRIIEEVYGDMVYETACNGPVKCKAEYVYGDSVAEYTPIHVRIDGKNIICTISDLAKQHGNDNWIKCTEPGKQEKEFCELENVETWTESGWTKLYRVIRHELASHKKMVRIITNKNSSVDVTDDHSLLRADGTMLSPKECIIGTALLARNISENATEEYITSIETIEYSGYVYDLTTQNHHFAAGVGNLIVHNTDSVFFTFNLENPETGEKIRGKPALEMTIEIAQDAAQLCTKYLKPPMELSYEKTLMPFILLSKKRYVGMLYEEDPNKGKLKFMGLVLKRRDNCDLVKDVYGGVLDILMKGEPGTNSVESAIEFLNRCLNELIEGKVPMDKLTITKALRSYYKNPQQIAHKVLGDRIGKRDPGNKPKAGDRIKYVYVNVAAKSGVKLLQGDKIETPDYIVKNKLQINYTHYITNQLMKPLQQLFGLALEHIWQSKGKEGKIKEFKKRIAELEKECDGNLETFMKKREKISSAEIKALLFDAFLTKIYQTQNGIRPINSFFRPIAAK